MKKFMAEFKDFISRGNVMDLAVGMIIGAAFTAIVKSLVDDLLMPVLGLITGGIKFEDWKIALSSKADGATLNLGNFISAVISFLAIAFVVFLLVKALNKLQNMKKKPEPKAAPTIKICPYCKSDIAIDATRCPHCTSRLESN